MGVEYLFASAGVVGGPLATARDSFVATRGIVCTGVSGAGAVQQGNSASWHIFQDSGDYLDMRFANFYVVAGSPEQGPGADTTIEAFIEYPLGSARQRLTFGGQNQGVIPNGGMLGIDRKAISYRAGEPFRIWTYRTGPSGLVYFNRSAWVNGEVADFATSSTNVASAGTIPTTSGLNNVYGPIEITGLTRKRTVAIIGDSIDFGLNIKANTYRGDTGVIARSIGKNFAYSKLAISSEQAQQFLASHDNRLSVALKASDVFVGYGTNDAAAGRTAAQINADTLTIGNYFPSTTNLYLRTLLPRATSTDNFATDANQTIAAYTSVLEAVNGARKNLPAPFKACHDVFTLMSNMSLSGSYSNKWRVDAASIGFFMTDDGIHPSQRGDEYIEQSGLIRLLP